MALEYEPVPGAKERIAKSAMVQRHITLAAQRIQADATAKSKYTNNRGESKTYTYHTRSYRNNKGFPHAGVFISWKRPSKAYSRAVDILKHSL